MKLSPFDEPELDFIETMRNRTIEDDLKWLLRNALIIKPLEHILQVGKAGFESFTATSHIGW